MQNAILSRNFYVPDDLVRYLSVLENKALKSKKEYNKNALRRLFGYLILLKKEDNKKFNMILNKLGMFTEEEILNYSYIIVSLLELTEEEQCLIMPNLKYKFESSIDILDMINFIIKKCNKIISDVVGKIILEEKIEDLDDLAVDIKNGGNDKFISEVYEKIIMEYPLINEHPITHYLFNQMINDSKEKAYTHITKHIFDTNSKKEKNYFDYVSRSSYNYILAKAVAKKNNTGIGRYYRK